MQPTTPKAPLYQGDNAFGRLSRNMQIGVGCITVLLVCCVLGVIVQAANGGGGKSTANAGQPAATSTQAGPTATPKPTATATPKPQPKQVFHLAGNGEKQTDTFTVAGSSWKLEYTCSGVGQYLDSAPLYIMASKSDGGYTPDSVSYNCPQAGGSDSSTFHDKGTFYLHIISGINWEVTVTDLP